jgi:hypothetical protein
MRHLISKVLSTTIVALIIAVFALPPTAQAAYTTYTWGSPGAWLTPTPSWTDANWGSGPWAVVCMPGFSADTRFIQSASPVVGRSPARPNSTQLIEMWPFLDRWESGSWKFYRGAPRQWANVPVGHEVTFNTYTFDSLSGRSYFRVGYYFRFWAGGTKIGEAVTYSGAPEYRGYGAPDSRDYCFTN